MNPTVDEEFDATIYYPAKGRTVWYKRGSLTSWEKATFLGLIDTFTGEAKIRLVATPAGLVKSPQGYLIPRPATHLDIMCKLWDHESDEGNVWDYCEHEN